MDARISVIVPTCWRPALLVKCVGSLLEQDTDQPFEIIVVIDGPDDITRECICAYVAAESNTKVAALPDNSGPAAARNYGVSLANGELLVFIDDDCVAAKDFLQQYWKRYQEAGTARVAFTGTVNVPLVSRPTDFALNTSHLATAEFVTANCAVSRNAFDAVGGFDEAFTMAWREDSDLQFRLMDQFIPILSTPDAVVTHPVRTAPWGVCLRSEQKNLFDPLLYRKFPKLYRQKIRGNPLWEYYLMVALFVSGLLMLLTHQLTGAILLGGWAFLVGRFVLHRLKNTSRDFSHVVEVVVTTPLIPFCSLYWNMYGNIKFKSTLL